MPQDYERAIDHYTKGAAKNNALCYFALSNVHSDGSYLKPDDELTFLYLKRSAEEGFV